MSIPIGWSQVGAGATAFILAEVASAHQGDVNQAMTLARAAKDSVASGIKFQLFRASELVAPNDPRSEIFQKIELPVSAWERLLGEAVDLDLPVLADVLLDSTYEELALFGNAAWHITPGIDLSFGARASDNEQRASQQSRCQKAHLYPQLRRLIRYSVSARSNCMLVSSGT